MGQEGPPGHGVLQGGRRRMAGCELGWHLLVADRVQMGAHDRTRAALCIAPSKGAASFIPPPRAAAFGRRRTAPCWS